MERGMKAAEVAAVKAVTARVNFMVESECSRRKNERRQTAVALFLL
jgi:hypothetical protein